MTNLKLQPETLEEIAKLKPGTVAYQIMQLGIRENEPLLIAMDAMIRYAKAHQSRFESPLGEDYVLGEYFLDTIKGIRRLLNGNGAVANERDNITDSKDNGVIEGMYWQACAIAQLLGDD